MNQDDFAIVCAKLLELRMAQPFEVIAEQLLAKFLGQG